MPRRKLLGLMANWNANSKNIAFIREVLRKNLTLNISISYLLVQLIYNLYIYAYSIMDLTIVAS